MEMEQSERKEPLPKKTGWCYSPTLLQKETELSVQVFFHALGWDSMQAPPLSMFKGNRHSTGEKRQAKGRQHWHLGFHGIMHTLTLEKTSKMIKSYLWKGCFMVSCHAKTYKTYRGTKSLPSKQSVLKWSLISITSA